eukprot:403343188
MLKQLIQKNSHYQLKKFLGNGSRMLFSTVSSVHVDSSQQHHDKQNPIDGVQQNTSKQLLFAHLCENGQGNQFKFHQDEKYLSDQVNFNYSTFWNDFSHYSIYKTQQNPTQQIEQQETPLNYSDLSKTNEDNFIFADKSKYVNVENPNFSLMENYLFEDSEKISEALDIEEEVPHQEGVHYDVFAHIPQEFKLSVRVNGDINGVNMRDTKLLSRRIYLQTTGTNSSITTRRLRNEECKIKAIDGDVKIGSYIETGILRLETQNGNVLINKKLGINQNGLLKTHNGLIQIGSIFANMANLPDPSYLTQTLEQMIGQLHAPEVEHHDLGLKIQSENQIVIDNLQGVVDITQTQQSTIMVNAAENAKFHIRAPNSRVVLHLRSLHDVSFIQCKSLWLLLPDDIYNCAVYDARKSEFIYPYENELLNSDVNKHPALVVDASENIDVQIMSRFDILKKQISQKVELKQATSRRFKI